MNELVYLQQYLQQMFGGMAGGGSQGGGWMAIVMLVVLVLICLYKPERIHSHVLFRWTCSFFVLSLVMPSVVQLGLLAFEVGPQMGGGRSPRNSGQGFGTFFGIVGVIQPGFLAMSMFCLFATIAPRKVSAIRSAPEPKKHPLDD
ncbi:MAG: hypothetical protein ACKVHR_01910 [Pirellulales bacterium]|jgi:hypothetical protein